MKLAPAVIVHGYGMALRAAGCASSAARPVTLLSGAGAGAYAGVGWWQALVAGVRAAVPGGALTDVLDCGASAGRALEALRAGQRILVLRADPRVWADIAGRAEDCGGLLLAEAPPALDLAHRGAARHLSGWLAGDTVAGDRRGFIG